VISVIANSLEGGSGKRFAVAGAKNLKLLIIDDALYFIIGSVANLKSKRDAVA